MKRKCKNVNIKDKEFVKEAVIQCFRNKRKKRKDIVEFLEKYHSMEQIVDDLVEEIENRKLNLKPIMYRNVFDTSSNKERRIGIQNIKQQIYDYIAVNGLEEVLKRIGTYQCASIKNRGAIYGIRAIKRWLKDDKIKYACKLDIKKCYPSIDINLLMEFLRKHVKNDDLLWLVETLLNTFENGLSIGSYLSQYLANLYLSDLYHEISENMFRIRHSKNGDKRVNLVKHVLFYMDDILILGTNARDLNKACELIRLKANDMGLEINPNWRTFKLNTFIDMMGFRIYKDHITLRRKVFLRTRKSYARFNKNKSVKNARKCVSRYGYLKHSNSFKMRRKYNIDTSQRKAKKVISNDSRKSNETSKS